MTRTFVAALFAGLLLACSGSSDQSDNACDQAMNTLAEYDTDPSTPDNIEPAIEDMAAFNEAYEQAEEACANN